MPNASPFLLLLDGMLCRDHDQIGVAMLQINPMLHQYASNGLDNAKRDAVTRTGSAVLETPSLQRPVPSYDLETVTRLLLELYPRIVSIPSSQDGSFPLHFAASIGNVCVVNLILLKHPAGASTPNAKGKLPLHYAAREGRIEVVSRLLEHSPLTVKQSTKKLKIPLHYAVGDGHLEISRKLLKVYPEGARATSSKGKIPLHFAARWGHLDIVKDLLKLYPEGVSVQDWDGSLPLHDSARQGQVEVASLLIKCFPEGLKVANIRGELPLLTAARNGSVDLVAKLVFAWPEGGKIICRDLVEGDGVDRWDWKILELCLRGAVGMLNQSSTNPLGKTMNPVSRNANVNTLSKLNSSIKPCVNRKKRNLDQIDSVSDEERNSINMHDRGRKSPFFALHAALECGSCPLVLRRILKTHSHQSSQRDESTGKYPLHYAAEHARGDHAEQILFTILSLEKGAVFARDHQGQLPLHIALTTQAPYALIKLLLQENWGSGFQKCCTHDRFANSFPLFMATQSHCELDVVYLFLRGDPGLLSG